MYSINDLPCYSPWPARLLGLEEFTPSKKNQKEVEREFGREKWGVLLNEIENNNISTIEEADNFFDSGDSLLVAKQNQFELTSFSEANKEYIRILHDYVTKFLPTEAIVELGSGYGSTILKLAKRLGDSEMRYYALELTSSGIGCARHLSKSVPGIFTHGSCNFLTENIFDVPIPEGSVIFTSFALHYIHGLPSSLINKIKSTKPKAVINFEPCIEVWKNSLYDLLKRKYVMANDYNVSILTSLQEFQVKGEIDLMDIHPDVFGQNPLLPASVLTWK